ncbi:MAG TPA: ribose ABC transporter permease [Clostridiaceae bacterium]|jgi:ribose transport system permease protein|nr:ribose ABC transporter permease [Clostridiaceae bacterium]HBN28123.1 ribose ABC transporter permease [Clostridiaceae bacterium]
MKNLGTKLITKYRTLTVLVLILITATFLSSAFLTVDNLLNVVRQVSIIAILAAGMTFVIITGGTDLSVGSITAIAGAISASMLIKTNSVFIAIIVGLFIGLLFGLANGLFISRGGMPPFIVTLATMAIARGCVLVFTNGSPIAVKSSAYKFIGKGYLLGIPFPIIILIIVYAIGYVILKYTKFGRGVYSIGGNREASRLSGINIKKVETLVYTISGLLAGLTGIILTSRLGSAQPIAGTGYELDAIAAVILGGTSFSGGEGSILPTVVGALILGVVDNILTLTDVNPFATNIVKGIVILLAVLADSKFKKFSAKTE